MAKSDKYQVTHSDGSSVVMTEEELDRMKESGMAAPDDKITRIEDEQDHQISRPHTQTIEMAEEMDTAPLHPEISHAIAQKANITFLENKGDLANLAESELNEAFKDTSSGKIYKYEASDEQREKIGEGAAQVKQGFHVQHADGRILGPFSLSEMTRRIQKRSFDGLEKISTDGSGNFVPIRTHPEFCGLIKVFIDSEQDFSQKGTLRFDVAGPVGFFLSFGKESNTGWLTFVGEHQIKVVAYLKGHPQKIYANMLNTKQEDELSDLFSWEDGEVFFEADPIAGLTEKLLPKNILKLVRQVLAPENGFDVARLLHGLGDQLRHISKSESAAWLIGYEQLSSLEKEVLAHCDGHPSIYGIFHDLMHDKRQKESLITAIFVLYSAGFIKLVDPKKMDRVKELEAILLSNDFMALYPVDQNTSKAEAFKIINEINLEANKDLEILSADNQERIKLQNKMAEVLAEYSSAHNTVQNQKIAPMTINKDVARVKSPVRREAVLEEELPERSATYVSLAWNFILAATVLGCIWILCVDLEMATHELLGKKIDQFLLIRPIILFLGASIGYAVMYKRWPWQLFGSLFTDAGRTKWHVLVALVLIAAFLGTLFSQHAIIAQEFSYVVFGLMILNAFFDRVFFSSYLVTEFEKLIESKALNSFIMAVIYSAFFLTYYELFHLSPNLMIEKFFILFFVLSLPLALIQIYFKSKLSSLLYLVSYLTAAFFSAHFGFEIFF